MSDTIFDGLDAIDWANLNHAYGSARNTPQELRNLMSPEAEIRDHALQQFAMSVFH